MPENREAAAAEVVRGWLESSGPQTARALAERLVVPLPAIKSALAHLEGEGQVLRGQFSPGADQPDAGTLEWCNRRVLERIHRCTLGRLRREIEPVSAEDFVRFLARWQHVAPGTQLHGTAGLLQVLLQLQGYEVSAAAWERDVLARRVVSYNGEILDCVCLSGEVMWGRLSPHPAFGGEPSTGTDEAEGTPGKRPPRRVRPTRVAPVAIFLREDASWLIAHGVETETDSAVLSHSGREVLEQLRARGRPSCAISSEQRADSPARSRMGCGSWSRRGW